MKRLSIVAVAIAILVVPSMVMAAGLQTFGAAKPLANADNQIVVPIEISNQANLAAMDIPLKFSEGVTLKEVDFTGTRVEYFDLKIASIDNDNNTVLIGLLPQMSAQAKPDLEAGQGTVANLVFEVNDPALEELTIQAHTIDKPFHELAFVYHETGAQGEPMIMVDKPDFESVSFALTDVSPSSAVLPDHFELAQNYPNPFNPTTIVGFSLPTASQVTLDVYNVLGQKVATLIDERLDAGLHEAEWDAGGKSSGVYFYRLTTEQFTDTKKMLLLK